MYGLFEVSRTEIKSTLVGINHDHSRKVILIVSNATSIDLPNCNIIDQMYKTPLLHVGSNSLISTSQAYEFGVAVNDVDKIHSGKWYTHAKYQVISTHVYKFLMYVPIQ